ncbi:hypothetical protein ABL78_5206 [Leptomonas seymouri]|uniref:Uncharacterized protein n=1 Tax=Leptomonas seymouri TaxID=5684 RepID=A0A0N0P4U6_LEPSE|nr:hypothetical protein ABL78_5206 [Leptomonas seymouri]|eukprot:KPI85719.1 hypothetical protein ABL78_5206 [Leptomonas seymouri]
MKSALPGQLTVAEQVAALPPLPQLLGLDSAESEGAYKAANNSKRVGATSTRAASTNRPHAVRKEAKKEALTLPPVTTTLSKKSVSPSPHLEKEEEAREPSPPPPSPPRCPGGVREWRHVQSTLQLPLAYRGEDDVKLTLRLLHSLPFFSSLLDDDLLTLAEAMSLVEVADAGKVVLRKRARLRSPPPGNNTNAAADVASAPTPSAIAKEPATPNEDDDDDGTTAARPNWMVPATELFQHFRLQMAQGEQPSLPPACLKAQTSKVAPVAKVSTSVGSRSSTRKKTIKRASANDLYFSAEAKDAQAADELREPLFDVPEEWSDEEDGDDEVRDSTEPFVVVLLSGHCELRWPRHHGPTEGPNTPSHYAYQVQPGDAMGYALVWYALPAGAQYVTTSACMFLKVSGDGQSYEIKDRLHRAYRRANEVVYKAQKTYLAEKLRKPLFTGIPASEKEKGADARRAPMSATVVTIDEHNEVNDAANPQHSSTALSGILKPETSTTSLDALLNLAARQLIPIRIPGAATVVQEGLFPATECALYFVVEGSCSVVRRLWSQDQQRLEARKLQLLKELTPPNGIRPVLTTMPSTSSMEVAQLHPGDYCGDLAYLRVDPDHAISNDAEWTSAYWKSTFAIDSAVAEEEEAGLTSSLRARRLNAQIATDAGEEATESKSLLRRHKATVITQCTTLIYVLLPAAAAGVVRGAVLERMKENARRCSSYTSLLTEYEKLYKWAIYKEKVLWEQSSKSLVPLR